MKNLIKKTYEADDTFVAPAGVTNVKVTVLRKNLNQMGCSPGVVNVIDINGDGWGWGNTNVGDNAAISRSSPVLIAGGKKWLQFDALGAAQTHRVGLTTDGDIYTWGNNNVGQLGNNASGAGVPQSSPVLVAGGRKYRHVIAGLDGCVALQTNGLVVTWGDNSINAVGYLGDNSTTNRSSPVLLAGNRIFKQLGGVRWAITPSGDAYGWGENSSGGLGSGNTISTSSPVLVAGGRKWKFVTGWGNFIGIDINDDLYVCGINNNGQLGLGDTQPRSSPTLVPGGLKWKTAGSHSGGVFAVTLAGVPYAWGGNPANGTMALNDIQPRSTPTLIVGGYKFFQLTQGVSGNSAFLGLDGNAYTAGSAGAAGDNNATVAHSSPTLVVGNKIFNAKKETFLNSMTVQVIPGNSYAVSMFSSANVSFAGYSLGNYYGLIKMVVEYYS